VGWGSGGVAVGARDKCKLKVQQKCLTLESFCRWIYELAID